ncbi:MAG: hypothetical protein ACK5AO_04500 [bacterium]|jgi:hypothetical protein
MGISQNDHYRPVITKSFEDIVPLSRKTDSTRTRNIDRIIKSKTKSFYPLNLVEQKKRLELLEKYIPKRKENNAKASRKRYKKNNQKKTSKPIFLKSKKQANVIVATIGDKYSNLFDSIKKQINAA